MENIHTIFIGGMERERLLLKRQMNEAIKVSFSTKSTQRTVRVNVQQKYDGQHQLSSSAHKYQLLLTTFACFFLFIPNQQINEISAMIAK